MKDIRTATLEITESSGSTGLTKRHFLLRALSLVISIFMMMAFIPKFDFSVNAQSKMWDGTSITAPPLTDGIYYYIRTAEELAWLSSEVNNGNSFSYKIIRIASDIQLNDTSNWESWGTVAPANSWTAIGSVSKPFSGIFDGQGHTISGIYINNDLNHQGFFGYCEDSTVRNVGITKSYIKGNNHVGGVVGNNLGIITNCYNTGAISGTSIYVGGVAGRNDYDGIIENCYNTGTISEASYIGGVVGFNYGIITNCYNAGAISGTSHIGGLAGCNLTSTIKNSYNAGTVSGTSYVGSVVGWNGLNSTITNSCYLSETPSNGFGFNGDFWDATSKTETQFKNGEVAYLLQGTQTDLIWGHTVLDESELPILAYESQDFKRIRKITFIDGTTEITKRYAHHGGTVSFPDDLTKIGYTFNGWNDYSNKIYTATSAFASDKSLFANWTVNAYVITYNLNGGTNNATNSTTYTYGVGSPLANPTKSGYNFSGWFSDSEFTNNVTEVNITDVGNKTLWAKWTKQEPIDPPLLVKKTPVITVNPITSIIVSGDLFSMPTLSGGYAEVDGKEIDGEFQWVYTNLLPEKSASYLVKFIPANSDLYEQAYKSIPVTVVENEQSRKLTAISNAMRGIAITPEEAKEADLNIDGVLNVFDKVLLKRKLLNK